MVLTQTVLFIFTQIVNRPTAYSTNTIAKSLDFLQVYALPRLSIMLEVAIA